MFYYPVDGGFYDLEPFLFGLFGAYAVQSISYLSRILSVPRAISILIISISTRSFHVSIDSNLEFRSDLVSSQIRRCSNWRDGFKSRPFTSLSKKKNQKKARQFLCQIQALEMVRLYSRTNRPYRRCGISPNVTSDEMLFCGARFGYDLFAFFFLLGLRRRFRGTAGGPRRDEMPVVQAQKDSTRRLPRESLRLFP